MNLIFQAVPRARILGYCLISMLFGACGTDRHNVPLPSEYVPEAPHEEADATAPVSTGDVSVLGSVNIARNLPVDSSSDTIIYTPSEEPKKVPVLTDCSGTYQIQATMNPFLAGMPGNSTIVYPNSTDRAPANAPAQLMPSDPQCMMPGRALYFKVDGRIAFGDLQGQDSNADGQKQKVVTHTLGSVNHIAAPAAPINSLIGVFLDATPTNQKTTTAASLDFSKENLRNFKTLSPAIGQIFFIGDGKDNAGTMQAFIVPQGATRLYVAIMDEYEWNNNMGKLTVTATWLKP